jgi:hypothetical protein
MRRLSILKATLLVCAGAAAGMAARDLGRNAWAQAATAGAPGYEYQVVSEAGTTEEEVEKTFNRFGKEGWHYDGMAGTLLIFERPRSGRAATPRRPKPEAPPSPGGKAAPEDVRVD